MSKLSHIKTTVSVWTVLLFSIMIAFLLYVNITKQSTSYGTGNYQYEDQVDSYSEYIIRNTVIHRVSQGRILTDSLLTGKGFAKEDYNYYPDNMAKYFSNRGIQAGIYSWIGSLNPKRFLTNSNTYFKVFRFVNCLILSMVFVSFFVNYYGSNIFALLISLLFSFSGGIALFSSNLYFMAWGLFLPLLFFPIIKANYNKTYVIIAFVSSIFYFSIRYEFATVFVLMWIFPVLINRLKTGVMKWEFLLVIFIASCLGFLVALLLHHLSVSSGENVTLKDASRLIFSNLERRIMSVGGVPLPFGYGFFKSMLSRWNWTGIAIPLFFTVTKFTIILVFLALLFSWAKSKRTVFVSIWALSTYLSWYLFGYQHIMWHPMYDSLLFSATIQLTTIILLGDCALAYLKGGEGDAKSEK